MRTLIVLMLLAPAGAAAAEPKEAKPDFVVTAEALAKEHKADRKAFAAKYNGKLVEVTGTVFRTRPSGGDVLLDGYKEKPTDVLTATYVVCDIPPKLQEQLRALAKGQQVTVRGKADGSIVPGLLQCEFVKVGPSPARPFTVAALAAEFKKDRDAARKKYDGKPVVLRVKVLQAKTDGEKVRWSVTDAAGKGGATIDAWADSLFNKDFLKELEKVKAGDVIVLLAEADSLGDPVRLWNAVVLKEPPAGVKLPGDKK
jgi:hypothetical protein